MNKQTIIDALRAFAAQRPGLEYGNYGNAAIYRAEARRIAADGAHAQTLLAAVESLDGITAQDILDAARDAFRGRLSIDADGRIDYRTGQYWPTEYRRAVCAVLSRVLWVYWSSDAAPDDADRIRNTARAQFGRAIASRYFN
jgi:hypothetical protein